MTKDTARASTQPAPLGKPGGPGLFHKKGQGLPTYIQNIRNAIMRKGTSESTATAMAIAMVKKLVATSKDPAVKAAAAKALAQWEKEKAASHVHASDDGERVELAQGHFPAGQLAFRYKHGWILINPAIPSRGSHGSPLATKHGHVSGGTTFGHFEKPEGGHAVFIADRHSSAPSKARLASAVLTVQTKKPASKPTEKPSSESFNSLHKKAVEATFKAGHSGTAEDHFAAMDAHLNAGSHPDATSEQKSLHRNAAHMHLQAAKVAADNAKTDGRETDNYQAPHEFADNLGNEFDTVKPADLEGRLKDRVQKMKDFYGRSLFVHKHASGKYPNASMVPTPSERLQRGELGPTIEEHHLYNLAVAHPVFHRAVKAFYDRNDSRSGIYVGHGGVDQLNDINDYAQMKANRAAKDEIDKRTLAQVGGINVIDPNNEHAVMGLGTVPGGSVSTALHEHGHAVDAALGGAANSPAFLAAWDHAREDMLMSPYYANGQYGNSETFAEAYDAFNVAMSRIAGGTKPFTDRLSDDRYIALTMANALSHNKHGTRSDEAAVQPLVKYFQNLLKEHAG